MKPRASLLVLSLGLLFGPACTHQAKDPFAYDNAALVKRQREVALYAKKMIPLLKKADRIEVWTITAGAAPNYHYRFADRDLSVSLRTTLVGGDLEQVVDALCEEISAPTWSRLFATLLVASLKFMHRAG